MEREQLGSRLGFIMLSAGCAIGCGNVWKFPWMCGQNGGGSFMLVYILCLIVLGIPALVMEFSVGRAAQTSPLYMYRKLEKPGQKWGGFGWACLAGNLALMAFYTVVCGWLIYYFTKFLIGQNASLSFAAMIAAPEIDVGFLLITVTAAFLILSFDLQSGLERITKIMMSALLVLMLVLAVHSLFLEGAREGMTFYLKPDFSKIDGSVVVGAMNQAFFTLSTGMGGMAIFGSYIGKERSLMGEAIHVILLDTLVAVLAGIIIFPACFTYDLEVTAGPSLLFDTMATVFAHMSGGHLWGTLFFLFMIFAAMSTVLGVCENILAMVRELTGWSRRKGSLVCGVGVFLLALTTALGFSVLRFQPFAAGTTWLDFWDFIVSTNVLPLGSLVLALFCCNKFGWGWDAFLEEVNTGTGLKVRGWMKPLFRYIFPAIIAAIYLYGIATFQWR
ncbi:sodium-dependent transporter [Pseudoflavonifractor sp. MSJ-37]|uniref:sodium-dependent transporter n=1 Tax=Pseudoflavonifractor sp. MSJ-37 TaxID=2841531 RepID=UPI001C10AF3C|nr:sodium-dependent transporter [Pseudoflavonifractor sp. MSJ-37]MBU5435516.1 sodium-dependent transporter [Pseudoflavonifractor sp. MSJ-37]